MRLFGLGGRMLRIAAALCLPTVAVVAFGVYFLAVDVPKIVGDERVRVAAETEKAAERLRADPSGADFKWVRGSGIVAGDKSMSGMFPATLSWKEWDPLGRAKRRDMWGYRRIAAGRLVWVRGSGEGDGDAVYARVTDIDERDYAFTFYLFGPVFILVLVGMTFLGVKYFADYVRSRDDFLAATAHDLTTPLVGMRYAIGRSEDDARALNERMLRLVDNIKDFMRLGGRRPDPKREPFDLAKACDEAYALFREDYRDLFDGDDVPVEVEGGSSAIGDETLAVQILWNLFGNDLKYAAPFGRVRVRIRSDGKFVKTEFIDEGKGMTPYEMRHAFDRYYRAKTVLESGKGGFGIGLCTAREFARAMGGELSVRANEPSGCVFTLALPAAPDAAPAAG